MIIALCGFMGCGKSTVGKALAQDLGYTYIDTDQEISRLVKRTIPEIFAENGEAYFRRLELKYVQSLAEQYIDDIVLSLGGGMVTNPKVMDTLKVFSKVIYVNTPFDICYDRIADNESRPIVKQKSKQELYELYQCRQASYLASDMVIDCEQSSEAVAKIKQIIGEKQ